METDTTERLSFHLQGIVAEINQAIGATGVVSNECKMVVKQYGDQIVEMLLDQVKNLITGDLIGTQFFEDFSH